MSRIWDTPLGEGCPLSPGRSVSDPLLSDDVRRELGKAIFDLQRGEVLAMPLSRSMPALAAGAAELRMRDRHGSYRAFYYTRSPRGILIFHAFEKKSRATPVKEIELGRRRLREMLNEEV